MMQKNEDDNSLLDRMYQAGKTQGRKEERERVIGVLVEWMSGLLCPPGKLLSTCKENDCINCLIQALEKLLREDGECREEKP
jgi:hypothetical protein